MRTSQNRRYQSETALNSPTSIVISFVINLFTIFQASTSAAQSKRQGQGEKEIVSLGLEERVGEDDGIHAAVRETAETTGKVYKQMWTQAGKKAGSRTREIIYILLFLADRTLATSKGTKHRGTGFNRVVEHASV